MLTRRTVLKGVAAASVAALVVTLPQEESPVVWDTNDWRDGMPVLDDRLDAMPLPEIRGDFRARYITGPGEWGIMRRHDFHRVKLQA